MHVDDIKAWARRAHIDTAFREELFAAMQGDNREHAVHAAWALTHLPKDDAPHIDVHREALTRLATSTADTSLRRLSLALLERIDWRLAKDIDPPDCYMQLLDFSFLHMTLGDEPYGVRSLCMKLAYKLSCPYPELLGELRQCLLLIEPSELGAGVRCTRNKVLNAIH